MIYPSLNYDFRLYQADANGKPAGASFTRATAGYRRNAIGLLESIGSGNLRHDYHPVTGEYLGALIEESRTNLLLQSEDLTMTWADDHTTRAGNGIAAPDGVVTADKIQEDNTTNYHRVYQTWVASAATYTLSFFARAAERNYAFAQLAAEDAKQAIFDLVNGVVGFASAGVTASMEAYPNGWWRCSMSHAVTAGTRSCYLGPFTAATGYAAWAGTTGSGIHAWGMQIEAGAYASSYIKTTTAPATRNADLLTVATSAFAFNPAEGTMYLDFTPKAAGIQTGGMRIYGSGGSFTLYRQANNTIVFDLNNGAPIGANTGTVQAASGQRLRAAAGYKLNDSAIVTNVGVAQAVASASLPEMVDTLEIGGGTLGTGPLNGTIRHIAYFPRRLSNADLQTISA